MLLVTYNNFNTTKECLESIMATNYPYYNVIIIDNGFTNITEYNCLKSSLDCNIHILNQSKITLNKNIYYYNSENNIGYGAGINKAAEFTKDNQPDFFFILNNDTIIPKSFFDDFLSSLPKLDKLDKALYSPVIKNSDNDNIWYAGGKINLARCMGTHHTNIPQQNYYETNFISGCCIICTPDIYFKLKGFDENFFLYYEDVDLSIRAKHNNIKIILLSKLFIYHKIGVSTGGDNTTITSYFSSRNRIYLMRKHFNSCTLNRFYCFFIINRIVKIVIAIFTGNFKNIKYIILGIIRGLRIEI